MANELSFLVRVRDFTKQGLGSAKKNLEAFTKGFGGGGILKNILGPAGFAVALGLAARTLSRWVDDAKRNVGGVWDPFTVAAAKSASAAFNSLDGFWSEFKAKCVEAAGWWAGIFGFKGEDAGLTKDAMKEIVDARQALADARDRLAGQDTTLAVKQRELAKLRAEIAEQEGKVAKAGKTSEEQGALDRMKAKEIDLALEIGAAEKKAFDDAAKARADARKEDEAAAKARADAAQAAIDEEYAAAVAASDGASDRATEAAEAEAKARKAAAEELASRQKSIDQERHDRLMKHLQAEADRAGKAAEKAEGVAAGAAAVGYGSMSAQAAARAKNRQDEKDKRHAERDLAKGARARAKELAGLPVSGDERRSSAAFQAGNLSDKMRKAAEDAQQRVKDAEDAWRQAVQRAVETTATNSANFGTIGRGGGK